MKRILLLFVCLTISVVSFGQDKAASRDAAPEIPPTKPASPASLKMTNADVIQMVTAGLSKQVIIVAIRQAPGQDFDLTATALIALKKAGVPDPVILAMQNGDAPVKPAAPSDENVPKVETQASSDTILAVVRAQVDAMNRKDMRAAVAVFDPDMPNFQQSKAATESALQSYDLRYTLKDLAIESITGDEARVRFSQVTENRSEPAPGDNRIEGIHTLRKHNGEWKIFSTQVTKIE